MSSQRERQRERERNQRQLTVPSLSASNGNSTLFAEPIRQKHDDETSKRIKSTLGDFDQVQKFMINDPKPLLGISTREITRIKGSNAKLQQIFSEMKNTLEPITALDDLFDDNDAHAVANACNGEQILNNNNNNTTIINNNINISSNTNTIYANNGNNNSLSNTNLNEIQQRIIQITERNNHSNYINDRSLDDISDDEHYKALPSKRRKTSSKTDAEIGNKTNANNNTTINNTNNGIIKNSSTSSESSGSSSSNSSSSSESSEDDDDEEEEKVSDDIKKEECSEKDAPKLSSHSQQPEIAEWNLETFMDKKTTTTTTTTSTTVQSSSATIKTNCADSVADVIDRVAKGELGEECDWSDDSFSLSPKKTKKSAHQQFETKRKEQSKQQSKHDQPSTPSTPQQQPPPPAAPPPQHKPSKNQQNKSPDHIIQDHSNQQQNRQNINELKSQQKLSSSPQLAKSLIVSIKLMLLKRIPGSVYANNCSGNPLSSSCSSSSSSSSSGSTNGDAVNATVNDDNIIKPIKTKASQNKIKLEKNKSIKVEPDVNNKVPRDLVKSITKSKISSKSSSQPPQESRIATSEHISSSPHLLCDQSSSVSVKLEPHSPQNHLLAVQMTPTQQTLTPPFNIPPPPTLIAASIGQNMTSAINLRTPPEIAGTSLGQAPDDYLSSAKKLKHAADREQDRTAQACKYLEAVLFFILTGNAMEQRSAQNEVERVCVMYRETLNLLRVCTTKFTKSRSSHQANVPTTDYKLTTLSYRCQSLLCLKLSRLKSKEIRDNNKLIQQQSQELALNGSSAVALVSVQQKQIALLQQYHQAHDTWQQADHLIDKHPSCKAFFDALDNECGTLSLNSTFDHLVHYVKTGLQILK